MKPKYVSILDPKQREYIECSLNAKCSKLFIYYLEQTKNNYLNLDAIETIAADLGTTPSNIVKTQKALVTKGWLHVAKFTGETGVVIRVVYLGKNAMRDSTIQNDLSLSAINIDMPEDYPLP